MEKYIKPALIANAATLGIHWIYDPVYIKKLKEKQDILFMVQNKKQYDEAEVAFYSYPNHKIGDVTVQGEMLKWLYDAMKDHVDFSVDAYDELLFEQFKPGGSYIGYVESYAQKNVAKKLAHRFEIDMPKEVLFDDHLVGFVPYLVCKELNLDSKKAWELAQLYSTDSTYYEFYKMFDDILENIEQKGMKQSVLEAIKKGPKSYTLALQKAIDLKDTDSFIEKYSGRACAIDQSIPLIVHLLYHCKSYEDAVNKNALIGGAISDRNMLLGAMFAQVSKIPKAWVKKVYAV
jgi:hypothetical protein